MSNIIHSNFDANNYPSESDFLEFLASRGHPLPAHKSLIHNRPNVRYKCPDSKNSTTTAQYTYSPSTKEFYFHCHNAGCNESGWYKSTNGIPYIPPTRTLEEILKKEREEEAERLHGIKLANEVYQAAVSDPGHAYLRLKRTGIYNTRSNPENGEFYMPLYNEEMKLVSVGIRYYDPKKLKWGNKRIGKGNGFFGYIALPESEEGKIYLAEGFGAAATAYEATGIPCFYSAGAKNLKPAKETIKKIYPHHTVVVLADNDEAGKEVAKAIDLHVFCPEVAPEDYPSLEVTDFNDFMVHLMDDFQMSKAEALNEIKKHIEENVMNTVKLVHVKEGREMFVLPESDKNGFALNNIENLKEMLKRERILVKRNLMSETDEIIMPGQSFNRFDDPNLKLIEIMSRCSRYKMPASRVPDYIKVISTENSYHPLKEFLKTTKWDGKTRLQSFLNKLIVKPEMIEMRDLLVSKWLVQVIESVLLPKGEFFLNGVLVLQGPQGCGKTTFFKMLFPFLEQAVSSGVILDPTNKDDQIICNKYLVVELGELDSTFSRSKISSIKAMLTRDKDHYRAAWDKLDKLAARKTVYGASVNDEAFLTDPTGNRRWWTVGLIDIDKTQHHDMGQIWAEIHQLYLSGQLVSTLSPTQLSMLNQSNKKHEVQDELKECIYQHFNFDVLGSPIVHTKMMTSREVYEAIGKPFGDKEGNLGRVGRILSKIPGLVNRVYAGLTRYDMPPPRNTAQSGGVGGVQFHLHQREK